MTGDVPPARQCTMPTCEQEATDRGAAGSLCERHIDALDGDSPDENPGFDARDPGSGDGGLPGFRELYEEAADRAGVHTWEYVPDEALRDVLEEHGLGGLYPRLYEIDRWKYADLEDVEGSDYAAGWYYASGEETDVAGFRRFHELLVARAPEGYEPYYFRVGRASKAPATQFGPWKDPEARLDVDEAAEWVREGGNVGIAGTPDDPLVNVDIDDEEAVPESEVPTTLRARSRSRWPGGHAWYFDPEGEVPNIPTDTAGEVRATWQYVVAPGSFVPAVEAELPDDYGRPGCYTVDREAPVATIRYDDLPAAFREFHEDVQAAEAAADAATPDGSPSTTDADGGGDGSDESRESGSALFDVTAEDVIRSEGGSADPSDRFTSAFHGSTSGANMSLSEQGRIHCWRHNVAHGATQALAALSDVTQTGDTACVRIGTGHKQSGVGECRLSGGALVWPAWRYAKRAGYIPDDDPIPHTALRYLALQEGVCDSDDLTDGWRLPHDAYNDALDAVRGVHGLDPGRNPVGGEADDDSEPVSTLPLGRLDALEPADARRYARKRGVDWPSTDEVRERLREAVFDNLRNEATRVLDAPTSAGKSHFTATTPWRDVDEEVTGGQPVIQFAPTTDARDENHEKSQCAEADDHKSGELLGRKDACGVCRGDYDPENIDEDDDREPLLIPDPELGDTPAGAWFDEMCDERGLAVSAAHARARELLGGDLPCSPGEILCRTESQWADKPRIDNTHRCPMAEHTVEECPDCYTDHVRCADAEADHSVEGCPDCHTERVRCSKAEHSVDECPDCSTERTRCEDAGTHGHSVDECPDCHTEHVRCAGAEHSVDECPDCSTERVRCSKAEHSVEDCPDCHEKRARCDLNDPDPTDPDHLVDECPECTGGTKPGYDVIHATQPFAYVPSLVAETNVIFDEQPDFTADLGEDAKERTDRVRRAITAFLRAVDAPISTWEAFTTTARRGGGGGGHGDAQAEADATESALYHDPGREWYFTCRDAHALAPALARAIWRALSDEDGPDANGRHAATVTHEPPRLDGNVNDDDAWNRHWVTVVVDDANEIRTVRDAPDLSQARSVVGLDAHPSLPLWQQNTHPNITIGSILDAEERRLWRRFERGLQVVQVGEATRPFASGEYFDEDGTAAVLEQLREHYGDDFRTTITASAVERQTEGLMDDAGIDDADTMHYGEEKSRNDFAGERVGLVNGSIDPGDDYVLDLLAECDRDARPETSESDEGDEERAHGRGFVGPDADTAAALLASVRENHVAQAAGRYARDADDPEDKAVVFVRTDASPPGFVDLQVDGVEWLATDTQREIVEALRECEHATAAEVAEAVGVTKEHVRTTLATLADAGRVECRERAGEHGAHVYSLLAGSAGVSGVVDLDAETTNDSVWRSHTWALAITAPTPTAGGSGGERTPPMAETAGSQVDLGAFDGGEPPPDDGT